MLKELFCVLLLSCSAFGAVGDSAQATAISPSLGPVEGKTVIEVTGTNFVNLTNNAQNGYYLVIGEGKHFGCVYQNSTGFSCVMPASKETTLFISFITLENSQITNITAKSFPFKYYQQPKITSAYPQSGDVEGGYNVRISGTDYFASSYLQAKFGDIATVGCVYDAFHGLVSCLAPPYTSDYDDELGASIRTVNITISENGQQFTSSRVHFTYTEYPKKSFTRFDLILVLGIGGAFLIIILLGLFGVIWNQRRKRMNHKIVKHKHESQSREYSNLNLESEVSEWNEIDYNELSIIGRPIGKGSDGVVFKAVYRGQYVAVKSFMSHSVEVIFRDFRTEMSYLSKLRHPHIIKLIGACTSKDHPPSIITEFVKRGSLYHIVRLHPDKLSWGRVTKIAKQIANGMHYLHSQNPAVIHRDLKSGNILIDAHWDVKIADFGLSRCVDVEDHTMTNRVGTTRWTAPEVLREGHTHYSEKADIYSYGMVLFELLSLNLPFYTIKYDYQVEEAILSGKLPSMPEGTPKELEAILEHCWDSIPEKRPPFEDILEALEKLPKKVAHGKRWKKAWRKKFMERRERKLAEKKKYMMMRSQK